MAIIAGSTVNPFPLKCRAAPWQGGLSGV